jgi:hypothetical protein
MFPLPGDAVSLPVVLRWNDIALFPDDHIGYRVRVVPLLPEQSPDTALKVNTPYFEYTTPTTDWTLGRRDIPGDARICVWGVQALDEEGYPIAEGWTEARVLVLKGAR